MSHLVLPRRFRGPLTSANGGYAAGRLAAYVDADAVEVTLRVAPPLDCALDVRREGDAAALLDGEVVVADARPAALDVDPPSPVSFEEAQDAATRHVRLVEDAFSECFTCGIRDEHDGLEIYAGAVAGREPLHAAPWVVGESAPPEVVWAAIDCPGAYAVGAAGRGEVVLGRMTARVARVPDVGERCVVVAWPLGEEGRKAYAGTALFAEDGDLLASARQTWIAPKPKPDA